MQRHSNLKSLWAFPLMALVLTSTGCKGPNAANIQLRKQNQELRAKVDDLERRHAADAAQLRAMEQRSGTTVPSLGQDRLDQLFTTHGIELGRLTGINERGELKVYAYPTDESGQPVKAAGSFVVEAFDLSRGDNARIGRWEFSLAQARQNWVGQALIHSYVLPLPWQQRPEHSPLTLKVTFTDALTGRVFDAQKAVPITLPLATSQPSQPSPQ
jgi:hypothetical protein